MKVYEFYLKEELRNIEFGQLTYGFYNIGGPVKNRVRDGEDGSAVYAVSHNDRTHWVQILVDDNTPQGILTAIEAHINGISDGAFDRYFDIHHTITPPERRREEIGI